MSLRRLGKTSSNADVPFEGKKNTQNVPKNIVYIDGQPRAANVYRHLLLIYHRNNEWKKWLQRKFVTVNFSLPLPLLSPALLSLHLSLFPSLYGSQLGVLGSHRVAQTGGNLIARRGQDSALSMVLAGCYHQIRQDKFQIDATLRCLETSKSRS